MWLFGVTTRNLMVQTCCCKTQEKYVELIFWVKLSYSSSFPQSLNLCLLSHISPTESWGETWLAKKQHWFKSCQIDFYCTFLFLMNHTGNISECTVVKLLIQSNHSGTASVFYLQIPWLIRNHMHKDQMTILLHTVMKESSLVAPWCTGPFILPSEKQIELLAPSTSQHTQ